MQECGNSLVAHGTAHVNVFEPRDRLVVALSVNLIFMPYQTMLRQMPQRAIPAHVVPSITRKHVVECTHGSLPIGLISNWHRFELGSNIIALLPNYLPN